MTTVGEITFGELTFGEMAFGGRFEIRRNDI